MDESVGGVASRGPAPRDVHPSRAPGRPPGAGLALSVVIDGRSDSATVVQVARLVGRLQLAGVWLRYPPLTGAPPVDLVALLGSLGAASVPAPAGLIADTDQIGSGLQDLLDCLAAAGADLPGAGADQPAGPPATGPSGALRLALCGEGWRLEQWPGRAAVPAAAASPTASAVFVPVWADRELAVALAGAADVAADRPVLVEVAVSVGRTAAEANARADGEELFTAIGHPRDQGLFGTLEECQADAARLAHAGATELVCHLPRSPDLPDVLAQLRAISVGASVLRPGEPPSSPPPPPVGWGGRRPAAS